MDRGRNISRYVCLNLDISPPLILLASTSTNGSGGSSSPSGQPGLRTDTSSASDLPALSRTCGPGVGPGAPSPKRVASRTRLPQGEPSFEPLVGALDSR